jgi:hypothetical protein
MGKMQLPFHVVPFGDEGVEILADFLGRDDKILHLPFNAHEKDIAVGVDVLVEVGNVAVIFENEFTDSRNDAFIIGAMNKQNG